MRRYVLHIITILLSAFAGTTQAQIVDTVCATGGPSNLAVPGSFGSTYDWHISTGAAIINGQGTNDILVAWPTTAATIDAWVVETSSDGCVGDTVFAQVYVAEPSTSNIQGPTDVCEGQYVEIQAFDSKSNGKFFWNNGDTTEVISFFATEDTTVYRVSLNELCEHDTVYHKVTVHPVPNLSSGTAAIIDTVGFNTTVGFNYLGTSYGTLDWYLNGTWLGTSPEMDVLFEQPGWNTLNVVATSGICSDTISHYLYVEDDLRIHIPSAFSPDGDGLNDTWDFDGLGFDEYDVAILDRYGRVVAQWDEWNPRSWDGTFQGSPLPTGVYVYQVRVMTINNHIKEYQGTITLIR